MIVSDSQMEEFDVFPECGFLPRDFPLEKLQHEYYKPWETLVANLPALILSNRLRSMVDKLPVLSITYLKTLPENRRAYQVLCFLSHAYVWGVDDPVDRLPVSLAEPLLKVSDLLGLPPIGTYAGLCLWNFKQIIPTNDPDKHWDLENLTTINTFTGSMDESWFYLVSVFFEHAGSVSISHGLDAMRLAQTDDAVGLVLKLQKLAESIDHLGSVLLRMEEMCDPHVFYFRIRPYLAGWRNMADVGLNKGGVFYGDSKEPKAFAGGSNAQSSLIQFLDILLGVKHYKTGERPASASESSHETHASTGSNSGFMGEMREYMPLEHRKFLIEMEQKSTIRNFVLANGSRTPGLFLAYDACLSMLKLFRDKHIRIVTRYIILPAKLAALTVPTCTARSGLAKSKKRGVEEKGTGGTSLLPFLKQCRDETGDPAAGSWGKRILSDGMMRIKRPAAETSPEQDAAPKRLNNFQGESSNENNL